MGGSSPPPSERRLALEQARANETEVDAILSVPQRLRFVRLALQSEGLGAFREPEVVEGLGLSPAQREQIRAIEEQVLVGQVREMRAGGMLGDAANKPREPEGPGRWTGPSPCSQPSSRDAGANWLASRSMAN